jgi:hypothetical protein
MRTESALKKNKTQHVSIPFNQASNIGIVFTVEDKVKHQEIKSLIQKFEKEGKKVKVLEFLPQKKDNYDFMFDFFTIEDVSFWGSIKSEAALKFVNTQFDYLFYIDKESNPLILYLLAMSKAHCRIGKFSEDEREYFEFMIEQNGSTKGLIDNMYNYTCNLR